MAPEPVLRGRYAAALAITGAATAIAALLFPHLHQTNIVMVFLLGVVVAALRLGRGPAVVTVVTSVLCFDFFFVTPYLSFAVSDAQYLVTFIVMLIVGLVITELTTRLQRQAVAAREGETRAVNLYELARELTAAPTAAHVAEAADRIIAASTGAHATVLVLGDADRLVAAGDAPAAFDPAAADAAFAHRAVQDPARRYLPLDAAMRTRGVLVVAPAGALTAEHVRLLETFAALVALALERVHYVDVAQRTLLGMESERLRNSLLSAISHDLRTPLTAMVGTAEALAMHVDDADARREADAIRRQARQLASLVENLLEMARLQGGEVRLKRDWQSMEELVGAALASLEASLEGRAIETDLPPDLPLVRCDAVLMERVLANLVENAAKYSPAGARIGVAARVEGDRLATRVWDEGPGLPPGSERRLFEKFSRGDDESPVPGVGLGLAIAQAIVAAHGGTLVAANRSGGGAVFTFTLPLEPAPADGPDGGDGRPASAGALT